MKRLMMVTALMLAATSTSIWAQAPAADDPHHPPQSLTPAPAPAQPMPPPATQSQTQSSQTQHGARDMMKEMQSAPAHSHDACCSIKKSTETP